PIRLAPDCGTSGSRTARWAWQRRARPRRTSTTTALQRNVRSRLSPVEGTNPRDPNPPAQGRGSAGSQGGLVPGQAPSRRWERRDIGMNRDCRWASLRSAPTYKSAPRSLVYAAPVSVGWADPGLAAGEAQHPSSRGGVWEEPRSSLGFAALSTNLQEHSNVAGTCRASFCRLGWSRTRSGR